MWRVTSVAISRIVAAFAGLMQLSVWLVDRVSAGTSFIFAALFASLNWRHLAED
jgi:hypothetical protein